MPAYRVSFWYEIPGDTWTLELKSDTKVSIWTDLVFHQHSSNLEDMIHSVFIPSRARYVFIREEETGRVTCFSVRSGTTLALLGEVTSLDQARALVRQDGQQNRIFWLSIWKEIPDDEWTLNLTSGDKKSVWWYESSSDVRTNLLTCGSSTWNDALLWRRESAQGAQYVFRRDTETGEIIVFRLQNGGTIRWLGPVKNLEEARSLAREDEVDYYEIAQRIASVKEPGTVQQAKQNTSTQSDAKAQKDADEYMVSTKPLAHGIRYRPGQGDVWSLALQQAQKEAKKAADDAELRHIQQRLSQPDVKEYANGVTPYWIDSPPFHVEILEPKNLNVDLPVAAKRTTTFPLDKKTSSEAKPATVSRFALLEIDPDQKPTKCEYVPVSQKLREQARRLDERIKAEPKEQPHRFDLLEVDPAQKPTPVRKVERIATAPKKTKVPFVDMSDQYTRFCDYMSDMLDIPIPQGPGRN